MTEIELSGQEPDASNASQQPTSNADGRSRETVHSAGDWMLLVDSYGFVAAREDAEPFKGARWFTTRSKQWAPQGADYRYGKTIEKVLARYAHETRFERGSEEHGAALRNGIINAVQSVATDAPCAKCEERATHVRHVNAPTGPKTAIVCDDHATEGRYVTNHPLENSREQGERR